MKYILIVLLGLLLLSCDSEPNYYQQPEKDLSAEIYNGLMASTDTVVVYHKDNDLYVLHYNQEGAIVKYTMVSESDLFTTTFDAIVFSLLIVLLVGFIIGGRIFS